MDPTTPTPATASPYSSAASPYAASQASMVPASVVQALLQKQQQQSQQQGSGGDMSSSGGGATTGATTNANGSPNYGNFANQVIKNLMQPQPGSVLSNLYGSYQGGGDAITAPTYEGNIATPANPYNFDTGSYGF